MSLRTLLADVDVALARHLDPNCTDSPDVKRERLRALHARVAGAVEAHDPGDASNVAQLAALAALADDASLPSPE